MPFCRDVLDQPAFDLCGACLGGTSFQGATPRFDPHPSTYVCCLQNYSQDVRLTDTLTNKNMIYLFFYLPSDNYTHKLVDYVNEMANALFLTVTP